MEDNGKDDFMTIAVVRKQQSFERATLTVQEAAEVSGLSPWTWRRWAYDGKVASIKAGKRLLIPAGEIARVLSEGLRPAIAAAE